MKDLRKILALICLGLLTLGFASCNRDDGGDDDDEIIRDPISESEACKDYLDSYADCQENPSWSCVAKAINCEKAKQNELKEAISN